MQELIPLLAVHQCGMPVCLQPHFRSRTWQLQLFLSLKWPPRRALLHFDLRINPMWHLPSHRTPLPQATMVLRTMRAAFSTPLRRVCLRAGPKRQGLPPRHGAKPDLIISHSINHSIIMDLLR